MEKINVKNEGEIITIKPEAIGSIAHTFRVMDGRATHIESPHNNVLKNGLALTAAATVEEVNKLIGVLETLRDIMLSQKLEVLEKEPKFATGTLVETNDKRYGIVKKVDWFSTKVLGRKDYQIQFPDGVGIFREDEIVRKVSLN